MTRTLEPQTPRRGLQHAVAAAVVGLTLATANTAQAQRALGLPFVGRNQFSVSVTELSRDGVSTEKAAVFGVSYGRRFNGDDAPVQLSMIVRAAARALDATDDGILDAGLTLAASHSVRAIDGLSITGAAGLGAVVWGEKGQNPGEVDRGRILSSIPLSAGLAYDVRAGRATIAPFVSLTGAYSRNRAYVNDEEITRATDWRLGHTAGVSVRFREAVVSLSRISRQSGMPDNGRVALSAGMSW